MKTMTRWQKHRIRRQVEEVTSDASDWARKHPAASLGIVSGVSASLGFVIAMFVGRSWWNHGG